MQDITKQSLTFRVGNPDTTDYDRFAELLNAVEGGTVQADSMRSWDAGKTENDIHFRYAACIDDEVIGYGVVYKAGIDISERFLIWATIAEAQRKQGFGSQ